MKKNLLLFLLPVLLLSCKTQKLDNQFSIVDIGSTQISTFAEIKNNKPENPDEILVRKIYTPNKELWEGYLGDENDFLKWTNEKALSQADFWKENKEINSQILSDELKKYAKEMSVFTGYKPKGKWYLVYGPAFTDLGGLSNGVMLIDLANKVNINNNIIINLYPHELNHQIYSVTKPQTEKIVLDRIIDEGFATYVSYIFHKKKYTKADELKYTEEEFQYCISNEGKLIGLLKKYYLSNDENQSRDFSSRNYKIGEKYPGAIGYYLGFRIVEEFVKRNGEDSWKKIYTMKPIEVLEQSFLLK